MDIVWGVYPKPMSALYLCVRTDQLTYSLTPSPPNSCIYSTFFLIKWTSSENVRKVKYIKYIVISTTSEFFTDCFLYPLETLSSEYNCSPCDKILCENISKSRVLCSQNWNDENVIFVTTVWNFFLPCMCRTALMPNFVLWKYQQYLANLDECIWNNVFLLICLISKCSPCKHTLISLYKIRCCLKSLLLFKWMMHRVDQNILRQNGQCLQTSLGLGSEYF